MLYLLWHPTQLWVGINICTSPFVRPSVCPSVRTTLTYIVCATPLTLFIPIHSDQYDMEMTIKTGFCGVRVTVKCWKNIVVSALPIAKFACNTMTIHAMITIHKKEACLLSLANTKMCCLTLWLTIYAYQSFIYVVSSTYKHLSFAWK